MSDGYTTCNNCGQLCPASDNFCESCGAMLTTADPSEIDELNESKVE